MTRPPRITRSWAGGGIADAGAAAERPPAAGAAARPGRGDDDPRRGAQVRRTECTGLRFGFHSESDPITLHSYGALNSMHDFTILPPPYPKCKSNVHLSSNVLAYPYCCNYPMGPKTLLPSCCEGCMTHNGTFGYVSPPTRA